MENIYVGADRPLKSIQEVLFLKGNSNLNIMIDEGEYTETVVLNGASNINITGVGKVVFTRQAQDSAFDIVNCTNIKLTNLRVENLLQFPVSSGIDVNTSKSIFITKCTIHNCKFIGLRILNSSDVHLFNNVITENRFGIYFYHSNGSISNNSVLLNEEENISIVESDVDLSKNVAALSKKGIVVNNDPKDRQIEFNQNLSFSNKLNVEGHTAGGIIQTELDFEDEEGHDFRLKDKTYAGYGASEPMLLQFEQNQQETEEDVEVKAIDPEEKVSVFLNMSMENLIEEYSTMLEESAREWHIPKFTFIYSAQELDNENTDVLLIINALDEFRNKDMMFELIDECQYLQIPFHVFVPSEHYEVPKAKINAKKLPSVEAAHERLFRKYPSFTLEYNDLEELSQKVYEKLQTHIPKIIIEKLKLENIGHFDALELEFDEHFNCLVGLNGTGKTTILRSIALGMIGPEHKQIIEQKLENLLRIIGLDEERNIQREDGSIALTYTIDGHTSTNVIRFRYASDSSVEVTSESDFKILQGNFIKSLVIGFAQTKLTASRDQNRQRSKIQPPHIIDLIPLINNTDDSRLEAFGHWIGHLFGRAHAKENKILRERGKIGDMNVKEREIIDRVFNILYQITGQQLQFKDALQNNEVWLITQDAPDGIPLELLGQGMQSLIGWVGYFIQRMSEAYANSDDFTQENAICIIDEIDFCLHPRWQSTLLKVMRGNFPNTQFFFTTHSPLMAFGLNREQIIKLEYEGSHIVPRLNLIDTWALSYQDILSKLFDTEHPEPIRTVDELQAELDELEDGETDKRNALLENINRLVKSNLYKNELAASKAKLEEREKELDMLISKLKAKEKQ